MLHDSNYYFCVILDTTSIDCDKQSVCPEETVTCTCTTGNSNTLTWTSNGDSLTFASTDPLGTRRDVNGLNTYAVLADTSDTNGIRVITSNLTFVASSFGSSVVLTCANVDLSTSESVIIPVSGRIKSQLVSDLIIVMMLCYLQISPLLRQP